MPNCKSLLVTEAERKHVRRRARFQQHRDVSYHQVFSFPARQGSVGNHAILTETLGVHAPSYATVKNWVAQFKRGDLSTCDAPHMYDVPSIAVFCSEPIIIIIIIFHNWLAR